MPEQAKNNHSYTHPTTRIKYIATAIFKTKMTCSININVYYLHKTSSLFVNYAC